ncbi:MAG TPA: DUF2267 domain-containing protein [Acidimicrobiales bacterium]
MKKKTLVALAAVGLGTVAANRARRRRGELKGQVYRLSGRRPDPDVDHNVLADRIRSTLGPIEARLDLPRIHVMVEDHVALLHGDVATEADAAEIEAAVAAVSGVEGVESYLHVGLLPSDTRPSEGRRRRPPSAAMRRLLEATEAIGVTGVHRPRALCAVLSAFTDELPAEHARQLLAHLPEDVRQLTALPRRLGIPAVRARTAPDLTCAVAQLAGVPDDRAQALILAVLNEVRSLVPEEVADVAAVLPVDLRPYWLPDEARDRA